MEIGVGVGTAWLLPDYAMAIYSTVGVRPGVALTNGDASFLPETVTA